MQKVDKPQEIKKVLSEGSYEEDQFDQREDGDEERAQELLARTAGKGTSFKMSMKDPVVGETPRQTQKAKESKYYQGLEESQDLKAKQSQNDPLKEFYQLKETLNKREEEEETNEEWFHDNFPKDDQNSDSGEEQKQLPK